MGGWGMRYEKESLIEGLENGEKKGREGEKKRGEWKNEFKKILSVILDKIDWRGNREIGRIGEEKRKEEFEWNEREDWMKNENKNERSWEGYVKKKKRGWIEREKKEKGIWWYGIWINNGEDKEE